MAVYDAAMASSWRPLLVLALFASLSSTIAACAPRAEVSVQVLTDLVPQVDFDRLALFRDGSEIVGRNVPATQRFDTPYILAELTDIAPGTTVRLRVELQRGGGTVLSRTIETRIDASRVLLFVLSSACRGVACPPADRPAATECEDGLCVEPVCQGAACSPDADVEEIDAALAEDDAGTMDDAALAPDAAVPPDAFVAPDAAMGPDAVVPADAFVPIDAAGSCAGRLAGFVCRASTGPCDPEERCDGRSTACPRGALSAAGTVCRDRARDRPCDAIETCDGRSAACPPDRDEPNGTTCNQYCGAEMCMDGVCSGGVSCNPITHACCDDRCAPTPCRAS